MKWFIVIVAGLTLMLGPGTAFAGENPAEELYKKSKERYQNGQFEQAATLLEEAYAEDPKLVYQFNRILALEGAEKYEQALEVLEAHEEAFVKAGGFEEIPFIKKSLKARINQKAAPKSEKQPEIKQKNGEKQEGKAERETEKEKTERGADQWRETETAEKTKRDIPTPQPSDTKKTVGWGLVGASGAFYGTALIFGSYLPYAPNVRDKLKNGGPYTTEEVKAFRTNQKLSIGALALGTATLIGAGWLLMSKSESPKTASVSVGPGNMSVKIRF